MLMSLFADRGYLYLVVPDEEGEGEEAAEPRPEGAPQAGETPEGMEAIRARIAGMSGPGLSELPLLAELRPKVGAGNVYLFARPVGEDASTGFRGIWAALRAEEGQMELEGWVSSEQTLLEGTPPPIPALLEKAPADPIAAMTVSIPPEQLAKLAFGAPGSERRERALRGLREQGFDAAGADSLLGALRGDMALLAYFDAPAFYRNFIRGSRRPEPRGTLLLEAGLLHSAPVVEWLTQRLKARGQPFEVVKGADATLLRTRMMEQPVELSVSADRLMMRGGEALQGRAPGAVAQGLRERFGTNAFEPGHVSAMVDVGRLRTELAAPQEVPGVPSQQLPVARSLVGTLFDQLPPVEHVFLDFTPEQGGGRFRARATLRAR
jgi:hypothetical protein